jgi:hypothetical protein
MPQQESPGRDILSSRNEEYDSRVVVTASPIGNALFLGRRWTIYPTADKQDEAKH